MSKFFLYIYDRFAPHKGLVLTVQIILIAILLGLATTLNYQEDISSFLPMDKQTSKYTEIYDKLCSQKKIAIIFRTKAKTARQDEYAQPKVNKESQVKQLQIAMESFGKLLTEMDSSHCVRNMQVRVNEEDIIETLRFVWQNYPYLMTEQDYQRADSLLNDPTYIENQLDGNYQSLMLPTSSLMTQSLSNDPLHLSASITSSMQNANFSSAFQIIDGYIFTQETDKSLIFFESPYGVSESRKNAVLANLLDKAINKYQLQNKDCQVDISAIGAPLIAVTNAKQIKQDSIIAVTLAFVLIILVLLYVFRRFIDIFWIGICTIMGWLFAIGCIALLKDRISIIVLGIGSVIIGIAVNYPLHFLAHFQHIHDSRTTLKEMVSPLLIGNITTVSAFLCLIVLDAEAMRDLGLFASLMLIGAILFVLIFLPILAPFKPWERNNATDVTISEKSNDEFSNRNKKYAPIISTIHNDKLVFWSIMTLTIIFAFFSLQTSFDADMQHINYMTQAQHADMQLLLKSMEQDDSTTTLYAIAEGKTLEKALQKNEELVNSINDIEGIKKISGIGQFVPSKSHQQKSLKNWDKLWREHRDNKDQFMNACKQIGFSPSAFAPFIDMIHNNLEIQESDFFQKANRIITENFIIQNQEGVKIANIIQIDKTNYSKIKNYIRSTIPEEAYVFDSKDISSHLVSLLSDSFNFIGSVCIFIVFFFLYLSFGRLELGGLSFLPLAISWIWILGIMQLLDIKFNIVNIILATFIFGQGDDYTIFITEGMMCEYAYGKKTMSIYKRSVAISAIIMFIGVGTLILSKHPALKSLAEVAIVGMIIVVFMSYYIPPLVFHWLTKHHGEVREYPITLKRILYSLYALGAFLLGLLFSFLMIYVYSLFVRRQERLSQYIHKLLYGFSRFVINRVPGTTYNVVNINNEVLEKPALIICNHQSQLDLMAIMSMSPKITILTKDWVWRNAYYGKIIRASEFYPIADGIENYLDGMKSMVKRGFSIVVFPEGTRSADGILRFHKGAFILAQKLGIDILPVYLHGFNKVLPRHDFMLRKGTMTMEIGTRMCAKKVLTTESTQLRTHFHRQFVQHFEFMRRKYETASYFLPYIKYKYMYKGARIERRCNKAIRNIKEITNLVDRDYSSVESYVFDEPGQGEIPLIFAMVHRNMNVYAEFTDVDDYLVASHIQGLPPNLHYKLRTAETDSRFTVS